MRARESIRKTIDFAKRLDTETIQVSIAHPYPGTEFYEYAKKQQSDLDRLDDGRGRQSASQSHLSGAGTRLNLVDWVERFYGEYYFRPRVIWRVVRNAVFDSEERKRISKQAREYLSLRAKRKQFVSQHRQATVLATGKR